LGSPGYNEIAFRVALAEARTASGDESGARSAVDDVLEQIRVRAERIPDAAAREVFLTRVSENVRARELALSFGGQLRTVGLTE
jgi:hypothetical protein